MYTLPSELQNIIYSYDNTFHEIWETINKDISEYKFFFFNLFNSTTMYYVYCPKSSSFHMTNSLESPNYICSTYNINRLKLIQYIKFYNLQEDSNLVLLFDIENNVSYGNRLIT